MTQSRTTLFISRATCEGFLVLYRRNDYPNKFFGSPSPCMLFCENIEIPESADRELKHNTIQPQLMKNKVQKQNASAIKELKNED